MNLIGKYVWIYRNLHKDCFSIMYKGRVIAYTNEIILKNVKFVVQKAGYEKFKSSGIKNVHAFVRGTITNLNNVTDFKEEIIYNPKINNFFFNFKSKNPIYEANFSLLKNNKIFNLD